MKRLQAASGLILAFAAALTGCSSPMPSPDGGDTGPADGDGGMVMPDAQDAPADTGADAGTLCRMLPVEDLNTLGTTTGNTTSFTGDNRSAQDSTSVGIQVPSGISICDYRTTRQRIFKYTSRTESALRITTTNPGTDLTFDTTITVVAGPRCTASSQLIACNDDDPTQTGDNRRVSSLVTLPVRPAGSTVYIAVGAWVSRTGAGRDPMREQGTFELTVEELQPQPTGSMCDVRGFNSVCATGNTCVGSTILSDTGTCRADGTVPGAACTMMGTCTGPGLSCDSTNNLCFETVADGMPCQRFTDAWQRCGTNSTCVSLQAGSVEGRCAANGSVAGAACTSMGTCTGAGLACQTLAGGGSICLESVAAGGTCRTFDTLCPSTQDCVSSTISGTGGTCVDLGSTAGAECNGGACAGMLTCQTAATPAVCVAPVATGGACGVYSQCADGGTCFLTDPADRYHGICYAPGSLGGTCRLTGTPCDGGNTCSVAMPTMDNPGRCLATGTVGGPCRIFGTTACPMGSTCVRNGNSGLDGTCRANGSVAGTLCDAMGMCSGAGLTCNAGLCQAMATTSCDPRFGTNRCATGQFCHSATLDGPGMCVMPTTETEPNNLLSAAQSLSGTSATVRGSLSRFDLDCFRVSVPAGHRIFARANTPAGFCPAAADTDLRLDLYDAAGHLLGGDTNSGAFGCPAIDGNNATIFPWARNTGTMAADYTLCVRNSATGQTGGLTGTPIDAYVLDLSVAP